MNQYLFLFPIKEYFRPCIEWYGASFEVNGCEPEHINEIIDARYRKKGYRVYWLMFSQDSNTLKPDLSGISSSIRIHGRDTILAAGVSFRKHAREKAYFAPDFVLDQVPRPDKLVVGGFHQWDCVDKIAMASYGRGIDTFVDEDTTESFFPRTSLLGKIPLERETWSLTDLGMPGHIVEIAKEIRKNKPWFAQI